MLTNLADAIMYLLLVGGVGLILYAFYRLLKFGLDTTRQHDD